MSLSRAEEAFVSQLMTQQNADAGTSAPPAAPTTPAANALYADSLLYAWASVVLTAGTPSVADSYNVSGVVDNGPGDFGLTFVTPFASTDYVVAGSAVINNPILRYVLIVRTRSVGSVSYEIRGGDTLLDVYDINHSLMLTGRQ